ncbi:MAG: hypothetical protein GY804_07010, partial [Alphaproteobacteria bacterium]|nr:hypothetical protein [Alphaproteobacteria bacterium]
TTSGTVQIKSYSNGDASAVDLTQFNDAIYYSIDETGYGRELWKTDGTEAGTMLVKDINPSAGSEPFDLTVFNGRLYFTADDGEHGVELWGLKTSQPGDINADYEVTLKDAIQSLKISSNMLVTDTINIDADIGNDNQIGIAETIYILEILSGMREGFDSNRAELIELYNSTNGDQWTNNSGWKTPPLADDGFALPGTENLWYGVNYDSDGSNRELSIYLYRNNLNGTIPESLCNMTNLKIFDVFENDLHGAIPENIGKLTNLESLFLADNQLTGIIPPGIVNLTSIMSLIINNNHLCSNAPDVIVYLDAKSQNWRSGQTNTSCNLEN